MALTGLFLARLPIIISAIIIGSPTARMQSRYINTKAPPPSVPALYGKPQIFPKPTAEPAAASTNVHFPTQETVSLIFEEVFPIILFRYKGYIKML